jgi:hypothetical protein
MLLESRDNLIIKGDLVKGSNLLFSHFTRFGLEMNVGRNRKYSKTQSMFFPAI